VESDKEVAVVELETLPLYLMLVDLVVQRELASLVEWVVAAVVVVVAAVVELVIQLEMAVAH
jgi:hypothetical protein